MIYTRQITYSFLGILILLVLCGSAQAAYVTLAQFDINGDGTDEIVRTEGEADTTHIRIYERLPQSYFFKPAADIDVAGNLVQVPQVSDLTGDKLLDLYFATGSDVGIIYYDTVDRQYKRQNEIESIPQAAVQTRKMHEMLNPVSQENQTNHDESDRLLALEKQTDQTQTMHRDNTQMLSPQTV